MNVLVVAPHPDDEVLGCGGTMVRHVAEGDTVDVVIVTRGDDSYDQTWIDLSRTEAKEAHAVLGVTTTTFLDFPSPTLDVVPMRDIVSALREVVHHDIVYIPSRTDLHQEHRLVHDAALVACRPPGPSAVYAYETLSETECGYGFTPNHYIDITDYLETKLAAMRCYQTQLHTAPAPRSINGITTQATLRGYTIHRWRAEAFETIRTIR